MSEKLRNAYNPEIQAGAANRSLAEESTRTEIIRYDGHQIVQELGLEWIRIDTMVFLRGKAFDEDKLEQISKGDNILAIMGTSLFPSESGELREPVLALYGQEGTIYKCPIFDEDSYQEKREIEVKKQGERLAQEMKKREERLLSRKRSRRIAQDLREAQNKARKKR